MRSSDYISIAAVVFGVIAIIMSFGAGLALMDITRGKEPNLALKWICFWAALVVVVIAQIVSIVAILRLQPTAGELKVAFRSNHTSTTTADAPSV
jgi:uncharacterized membrane protein